MLKNSSFFLKLISFFLLLFIWVYSLVNFGKLPETIPVHYNLSGAADGFGSKNSLWLLIGISTLIFLFLIYLSQNSKSQFLNIPQNLKENPEVAGFIVNILNVLAMSLFAVITFESMQNALGKADGLSSLTDYLLGLIFVLIIGMMLYSWKLSRKKTRMS